MASADWTSGRPGGAGVAEVPLGTTLHDIIALAAARPAKSESTSTSVMS